MFADTMLVFDHVTHKIKVLSHAYLDGDIEAAYQKAVDKIDKLIDRLNKPLEPVRREKKAVSPESQSGLFSNFSRYDNCP